MAYVEIPRDQLLNSCPSRLYIAAWCDEHAEEEFKVDRNKSNWGRWHHHLADHKICWVPWEIGVSCKTCGKTL